MRVTLLGCGGAGGVPSIGSGWGSCDPNEDRNRRLRSSLLIEDMDPSGRPSAGLLVDMGPDLREQILASGLDRLDGIFVTHAHADHIAGIDDVREINRVLGRPIPLWAKNHVLDELRRRFGYCFPPFPDDRDIQTHGIYRPMLDPYEVTAGVSFSVGSLNILPFDQDHGYETTSLGLRIGAFAYSTDLVRLDDRALAALKGVDTWIVGAMTDQTHPTHANIDQVLEWVSDIRPRQTILTHMGPKLDYQALLRRLPENVVPGYDGMVVDIG